MTGVAGPMRVRDSIIARCRREVEPEWKRRLRGVLLPLVRAWTGLREAGEGFQWGLPVDLPRGRVRAGRYSYIGAGARFSGTVVIGDLSMLSTGVRIFGDDHRTDRPGEAARLAFAGRHPPTVIEADCWIGTGAMLREGIRIGRGAVVAAGAVVTRSVAPYTIVAGVPARLLRPRFDVAGAARHDLELYGRAF